MCPARQEADQTPLILVVTAGGFLTLHAGPALERAGYRVRFLAGLAALQGWTATLPNPKRPAVILCDHLVTDSTGVELVLYLRSQPSFQGIPLLLFVERLTMRWQSPIPQAHLQPEAYLPKIVNPLEVVTTAQRLQRLHRAALSPAPPTSAS